MAELQNSFWEFSLSFYASTEVQKTCLNLQETLGADVNIVLFMLFNAKQGKQLSEVAIRTINHAVTAWRENIIQPIRSARKNLKHAKHSLSNAQQDQFKTQLMATELQAEKLEQAMIEAVEITWVSVSPEQAASTNIQNYAHLLGCDSTTDDFRTLLNCFNKHQ